MYDIRFIAKDGWSWGLLDLCASGPSRAVLVRLFSGSECFDILHGIDPAYQVGSLKVLNGIEKFGYCCYGEVRFAHAPGRAKGV